MMHPQSGKYTIAWFKLAEFVMRKEKERALGIYRLLSHSLQDQALASQLEGDLLLSFSDQKALESYKKASLLYEKDKKLTQAAALYEHLILLQPNNFEFICKMLKLYTQIGNEAKINKTITLFVKAISEQEKISQLPNLLLKLELDAYFSQLIYESLIVSILDKKENRQVLLLCLEVIVPAISSNDEYLTKFMAKLKILNEQAYNFAYNLLNKK